MEYRIKSSGDLKTRSELKSANKNTSFPNVWNESVLEFLNVDPVLDSPKPKAGKYEIVERDGVVQDSNNNWVQAWKVRDMFSDVTDDDGTFHSKAEQEETHQAEIDARTANTNRQIRNQLLAETDWTASSDVTMSDAMKAYRQALRDVPAQSGFPTDITWPTLGE